MPSVLLQHFGLRDQPFGVTPDPRFLYESSTHREALASLHYGIAAERGFLALIAKPGMGKTTLLFHLLEKFRAQARTAFIFQTQCDSRELLAYMLSDLGIAYSDPKDVVAMHQQLNKTLAADAKAGRRCIVVIDEAQNLSPQVLETIRLLSDFESAQAKLLHIVVAGQPALADKLAEPGMTQFRQRISMFCRLSPLGRQEVSEYITHRLKTAGHKDGQLFTPDARARIADLSEGIPRLISNICFNTLSLAYAMNQRDVSSGLVDEVAGDLGLGSPIEPEVAEEDEAPPCIEPPMAAVTPQKQSSRSANPVAQMQKVSADHQSQAIPKRPPEALVTKSALHSTAAIAPTTNPATSAAIASITPRDLRLTQQPVTRPQTAKPRVRLIETAVIVLACCAVIFALALSVFLYRAQANRTSSAPPPVLAAETSPEEQDALVQPPPMQLEVKPYAAKGITPSVLSSVPFSSVRLPGPVPAREPQVPPPSLGNQVALGNRPSLAALTPARRPLPVLESPPSPAPEASPVRAIGTVIRLVKPKYPERARSAAIQGTVTLEASVGTDGRVHQVQVIAGDPALTDAASSAVRQWRYKPYLENGRPVPFQTTIEVHFVLGNSAP